MSDLTIADIRHVAADGSVEHNLDGTCFRSHPTVLEGSDEFFTYDFSSLDKEDMTVVICNGTLLKALPAEVDDAEFAVAALFPLAAEAAILDTSRKGFLDFLIDNDVNFDSTPVLLSFYGALPPEANDPRADLDTTIPPGARVGPAVGPAVAREAPYDAEDEGSIAASSGDESSSSSHRSKRRKSHKSKKVSMRTYCHHSQHNPHAPFACTRIPCANFRDHTYVYLGHIARFTRSGLHRAGLATILVAPTVWGKVRSGLPVQFRGVHT